MAKKNITLNQLAEKMDKGFTAIDKKLDERIDDLGTMVKHGFDGVDKRFDGVDKRLDGVDKRLDSVDKRLDELKRDMEEVKLKFAYTAWAIDVEELKKRVIILEKKIGVK